MHPLGLYIAIRQEQEAHELQRRLEFAVEPLPEVEPNAEEGRQDPRPSRFAALTARMPRVLRRHHPRSA